MKHLLIIFCLVFLGFDIQAQNNTNPSQNTNPNSLAGKPLRDRIYVGGDIGLNFSNNFSFLNISPLVGYRLDKKLSVGASFKYQWYRDNVFDVSEHIYGGGVFGRYELFEQFLLHAEYEILNAPDLNFFSPSFGGRTNVHIGWVGAGYKQGFGGSYFQLLLLYDLINDPNSPYQNQYLFGPDLPLIIRGGFVIGL